MTSFLVSISMVIINLVWWWYIGRHTKYGWANLIAVGFCTALAMVSLFTLSN
jgi:hypothetical protein